MKRPAALGVLLAVVAWPAHAAIISVDYSLDSSGLFASNSTARSAVEAAAADIGNAITGALGAVTTDVYVGTNGISTVQFDWRLNVSNPATGTTFTQNSFSYSLNAITVYAGWRPLSGSTLGFGGPSGAGITRSSSTLESQLTGAVAAAETASNNAMLRGGGPVIGTLSGSVTQGSTTANYNLRYGAMLGSLSLDSDSDNDGSTDTAPALDAYWHYDHTTAVAPGKNDLYSVALHEILHSIGFGSSDSWDAHHTGTTWNGTAADSEVIKLTGTGAGMVSGDDSHVATGTMSVRLSDGAAQEAVMDPSLTVGTRKSLTLLDLAFLSDIGYVVVPEPSAATLALAAAMFLSLRRRRLERPHAA